MKPVLKTFFPLKTDFVQICSDQTNERIGLLLGPIT